MNIFHNFQRLKEDESEILNFGLSLAMEFGENWLMPIQNRLLKKYNFLNSEQLDRYDVICRDAMKTGGSLVHAILDKIDQENRTIKEADLKADFVALMLEKFPWIHSNNLKQLFSQGCYYAFKDGLDKGIE